MMKIFRSEAKRALNIGVLIGIIGVCFSICFDSWNDLVQGLHSQKGTVHYFFANSSWGGVCRTYFLPIFATLPFATSFFKDYNSRSLVYIISREGKRNYCIIKYIVNAICGGLVVAVATGLLFLMLSTQFPVTDISEQGATISDRFHSWIAVNHPYQYGMIEIISGFLRGTIWASISLYTSIYISDLLVIIISPYMFSFGFVQLCRLLRIDDRYRLDKLLTGNMVIHSSVYTIGVCTIVIIVLVSMIGLLFVKKVLREMEDGKFY